MDLYTTPYLPCIPLVELYSTPDKPYACEDDVQCTPLIMSQWEKRLQKGFCNIAFSLQKGCIATTEGNLFAMTMQHFKNVALQPHRKTLLQCCTFIATRLHGNLAIYSLIRPCIKLAKHLPGNVATCSPENVA